MPVSPVSADWLQDGGFASVNLPDLFADAIVHVLGEEYSGTDPVIRASRNPEFGDFQVNAAMGLGKKTGGFEPKK